MDSSVDLSQLTYLTSGGRELSLKQLIDHWNSHVDRLAKDVSENVDDDHAWGAEDFLAALYVRQRLAGGSSSASPEVRELLTEKSSASDDLFREITEPDGDCAVLRFAGEPTHPGEWWWSRIPKRGLPRRELDAWLEQA
jgi:hypothetical protein